jgi:UDP-N-acetylmuramyl pentapeptide phosphotransferase/UDP-N-acetylglucosamine-1-phosphate transferase
MIADKLIPVIIRNVAYYHFMDNPNERSSHRISTPTLGGVSFFASIMIGILFIRKYDISHITLYLIIALSILFFLGIKDDLTVLSSNIKIGFQTISIFIVLNQPELCITSFHGFLGIEQIPTWFGVIFGYFIVLYVINAYNLIDGIDGLAGMLGIFISTIFVLIFYFTNLYYYMFIAILIIGFLFAFLKYNLSKKKKIFMGDTGSMIVGFLLGFLILRFLAIDPVLLQNINVLPENIFIISLAIFFFPFIDVIRVVIIRLIKRQKPFKADRLHLHHIFIDKGLSHLKASATITLSSIFIFTFIYSCNFFFSYLGISILFFFSIAISFYILLILGIDDLSRVHRKKIKLYVPMQIYLMEYRFRKFVILLLKRLFYKELL